mgnify:CR=1 FL=1
MSPSPHKQEGRAKYRNQPVEIDGHRFASKLEGRRYGELKLLERAGEIRELRIHPAYDLCVEDQKVTRYVADFAYVDKTGLPVTEDTKGVLTPEFRMKAKLFHALFKREVVIVRSTR